MKLENGNGKRPIQDISFVGNDLYHVWWNGEFTHLFKNNETVRSWKGKEQGLSYPYMVTKTLRDLRTGEVFEIPGAGQYRKGNYATGATIGDDKESIIVVWKSGYVPTHDVKLDGVPKDLHLQGVCRTENIVYTLWGNSSMLTKDWRLMAHDIKTGALLSEKKAPWRPRRNLFAKRYEPEGLSMKNGALYLGYCVKGWFEGYKCYAVEAAEVFKVD